jgi:hypothetical protein
MKLEPVDTAELLAVLINAKESSQLFHQNTKGNTVLKISKYDKGGYAFEISSKVGETVKKCRHLISQTESIILRILLQDFIVKYYGW